MARLIANPAPAINFNFRSSPPDAELTMRAVRIARAIMTAPAMAPFQVSEVALGPDLAEVLGRQLALGPELGAYRDGRQDVGLERRADELAKVCRGIRHPSTGLTDTPISKRDPSSIVEMIARELIN